MKYLPQLPGLERGPSFSKRDRIVDWVCFAIAVSLGAVNFVDSGMPKDSGTLHFVAIVLFGAASCLSLFYRRRWPVAVGFGVMAVGIVIPTAMGAFMVALFSVAAYRPWKFAASLAFFGLATVPLYFGLYPDTDPIWVNLISTALVEAAIVAWGMYVRARRELLETLRERAREAEADRDLRLAQAREQERTRIAREMHDVLAHRISLVALNAGALEFRPDASPEEIRQAAAVVRSNAHQALGELRDVITVLRDQPQGELAALEPPQPTMVDIESLIEESRQSGAEVDFDDRVEDIGAVPAATGRTAYRVVQEGLTNVRKHAPGGSARVLVSGAISEGLTVEVSNRRPLISGPALRTIPGSGTGLIGLSERIELAGGRLEHGPHRDGQFKLTAWLPWTA